jgi:peptide/nickel transport system permease protein
MEGFTPPASESAFTGNWFLMGTDNQGRDVLSTIMYGSRISLFVGFSATMLAILIGVSAGLAAGYNGGVIDAVIMRIADIQLSFPAILIALLIFGIARGIIPANQQESMAIWVLILAIGLANWAQFARTVRGATMVETQKDYVSAARIMGVPPFLILLRHILPNVMGPVLVIGTISLALAVIEEATLSYLGVGVPPTQPLARHAHPHRAAVPVLGRMVDPVLPGRHARAARAVGEPAGRLAARRAEPEAEVSA